MIDTQPDPVPNDRPHVQKRAIDQLVERYEFGVARYRTGVQVGNGRRMSQDFREELQDALIYATGIEEGDDEIIKILEHILELHSEFQGYCNTCGGDYPCHTRVDINRILLILGHQS